ncbi:MAG: FAD-dependent oxidoreductase [Thermoanaerobaculum sp.]
MPREPFRVVVVGSGLAGLSCASSLLAAGFQVTVLTPGYLGRDGASHRVQALAPWILLTAPWKRGDSPERFFEDLKRAGQGKERPGLAEVFAREAAPAARELVELLDLEPLEGEPQLLPGNSFPRSRRFFPKTPGTLLAKLAALVHGAASVHEGTLAVGLEWNGHRVPGVWAWHRGTSELRRHPADAVVLACGGLGALFGPSTVPRWCRGSALALASLVGSLLHNPHITQALPVIAIPPVYFPTTAALLKARLWAGSTPQGFSDLETLSEYLARALRQGQSAWVELAEADACVLPRWIREARHWREGKLPLTLAVHHGVGGVAIDAWGRTSVPGLYACGEAAGGVQGARRLMGTGLLEARIFGLRAAQAVARDLPKLGPAPATPAFPKLLALPANARELEAFLDRTLGKLMVIRPRKEVQAFLEELDNWPSGSELEKGNAGWLAALRWVAARVVLGEELRQKALESQEVPRELAG